MTALFIALRLETPLLITGLGNGEENSSQSLSYIPGSALRGALITRFKGSTQDLPADPQGGKLFFSGAVRFLNAYPLDKNGDRMLPIPASWRMEKGQELKGAQITDLALAQDPEKSKLIGKQYRSKDDADVYPFSPEEEIAIHIASQGRGIVKAGQSTVFQYQSLARAQKFGAFIVANDPKDLDRIQELLEPDTLYLGRSRSAGYGKVQIEKIQRTETPEATSANLEFVTVTLLSDAILRDEYGQPTHDLDTYLTKRLGKTIKHQNAFIRSAEIGGFNRKWKLPLPQMPALGMGSVFVYPADQISSRDVEDLVNAGIGERRVDGFGRIAANWNGTAKQNLGETPSAEVNLESPQLSSVSKTLATNMAERLLRYTLEQSLVAEVNRYTFKGNITNHQLARLRILLRKALDDTHKPIDNIPVFFSGLKETAKKQWHNTRLFVGKRTTGTRLDLWTEERAKTSDGLAVINSEKQTDFPKVAGLTASLDASLKREFTLRLMEAVVDRAMKLNKEA